MTPSPSPAETAVKPDAGKFGRIASGNHLVAQNDEPDSQWLQADEPRENSLPPQMNRDDLK